MGERTTVIGTILAVVFQNEENGYTVARIVTDDGEPVTVVGCIPCAAPGEELILTGRYTTHPQHGEQFAADDKAKREDVDLRNGADQMVF